MKNEMNDENEEFKIRFNELQFLFHFLSTEESARVWCAVMVSKIVSLAMSTENPQVAIDEVKYAIDDFYKHKSLGSYDKK